MTDLLLTTDLSNASKEQLRALVKRVREETGKAIDLRKSDIVALRQYLEDYLATQATEPEEDDVIGGAAASVTDAIFKAEATVIAEVEEAVAPHSLADFEGIEQEVMQVTDWLNSCPLTCDVCNYQVCDLPEPEEDFEIAFCDGCEKRCELATDLEPELELPESFNATTRRTIDILLQFGTAYGDMIDKEWLQGILKDAMWRSTIPNSVTEKLLLSDPIYYGLAGIDSDSIALYDRIVKTPEEFGNMPDGAKQGADFYRNIGSLIGADKIARIAAYHSIRDNLNYLQVRLGISSLEERSYAIKDKLFAYQDYDQQMVLLPSDRQALRLEAPRIAEYFCQLIDGYQLYQELADESLEPLPEDFDMQAMMSHAFGCDYAWIHAESYTWQPSDGGFIGHHIQQLDPDKISLSLDAWNGSEYSSFMRLVAQHPNPARRPWEASQSS